MNFVAYVNPGTGTHQRQRRHLYQTIAAAVNAPRFRALRTRILPAAAPISYPIASTLKKPAVKLVKHGAGVLRVYHNVRFFTARASMPSTASNHSTAIVRAEGIALHGKIKVQCRRAMVEQRLA